MKVWVCSILSCETYDNFVIGVFSDRTKAENQANIWLQGVGENYKETDREYASKEYIKIYYETILNHFLYVATLEEFKLDSISY